MLPQPSAARVTQSKKFRSSASTLLSFRAALAAFFVCALPIADLTPTIAFALEQTPQIHAEASPSSFPASPIIQSGVVPATDYQSPIPQLNQAPQPVLSSLTQQLAKDREELKNGKNDKRRIALLEEGRTATTRVWLNADGSKTAESSLTPTSYKENGIWKSIDTTLTYDSASQTWLSGANSWQASFGSLATKGVTFQKEGRQVKFTPVGGRDVQPTVTGVSPYQVVTYSEVWPGVDVVYVVKRDGLKENIVLKNADSASSVSFLVAGAQLVPIANSQGSFSLDGNLSEFVIGAPNVSAGTRGIVVDSTIISQSVNDTTLTVSLNRTWKAAVTPAEYPIVIDPSLTSMGRDGKYENYKSDGFICKKGEGCGNSVGTLNDAGVWKSWRFLTQMSYGAAMGNYVQSASLYLEMAKSGVVKYRGTTEGRTIYVHTATEFKADAYTDRFGGADATIGESGSITLTDVYRSAVSANVSDLILYVSGEENNALSYKFFDPDFTSITVTYTHYPTTGNLDSPGNDAVVVTTQPALIGTRGSDEDGDQLLYRFKVGTSPDAEGGLVANSGWLPTPAWTVPDDVLQDGTTYYWKMQTWDQQTPDDWRLPITARETPTRSFRVDLRTGKDSTQAYDSVGGLGVDLATGNLTNEIALPGMSALAGTIGVNLTYNSPVRSHTGLVGQYWNCGNPCEIPGSNPALTRVEPNLDFYWEAGSPAKGVLSSDLFAARWTGYFIPPETGTYQFGADSDDGMRIWVNNQTVIDFWQAQSSSQFGNSVNLVAGQPVPIKIDYYDAGGWATFKLKVRGVVPEQIVPKEWLQTGIRPATLDGMVGSYYYADSNRQFKDENLFLRRIDPMINFRWNGDAPVPNGPQDNFMVRWSGYFTTPTDGTYKIGGSADDGLRVWANGVQTVDSWIDTGDLLRLPASGMTLRANQTIKLDVEYYEAAGSANAELRIEGPNLSPYAAVPARLLSSKINPLTKGWALSVDPDGELSYDFATIGERGITLRDASGEAHEYKWTGSGYTPPVNEAGHMVRNGDGTVTMQDVDGKTYSFNKDGTLQLVTIPQDDLRPAALRYTYAGTPARLVQIADGVDQNRKLTLYYQGDTNCPAVNSGAVAAPDTICRIATSDGTYTDFFYYQQAGTLEYSLFRIYTSGKQMTDISVDANGLITRFTDSLAGDLIQRGVRANDPGIHTDVSYDAIGRVSSITQPSATEGSERDVHSYEYLIRATKLHLKSTTEPFGFARRISYDDLLRTTSETDITNRTSTSEWHWQRDLLYATTDTENRKSTTFYDFADRPIENFGPAPAGWYGPDRKPTSEYISKVPHNLTTYDQGLRGLAAAYYPLKDISVQGITQRIFNGAPIAHTTGIGNPYGDTYAIWGSASPAPNVTDGQRGWGLRLTGRIKLAEVGQHRFRIWSDDGVRLYIDDQLMINDWADGPHRAHDQIAGTPGFNNPDANSYHRIRLEYYSKSAAENDSRLELWKSPPGGDLTSSLGGITLPDYGLTTSQTTFDSHPDVGNAYTTTNYGSRPELALAESRNLDPEGINYQSSATFERQGDSGSFLRQTSKTLPGGNKFTYTHYGATETVDNPCTVSVEAIRQGGAIKLKTDPDPDGAGSQTSRSTESIYNESGQVIATRVNNDPWTCTTYDSRGRVQTTVIPPLNGSSSRTIVNDWAVGGNPLVTSSSDANGTIITTTDLLGRVVKYQDSLRYVTTYTYDSQGRMSSRTGPLGVERFTYNEKNQVTSHYLDDVLYAIPGYDTVGIMNQVDYPTIGARLTLTRDDLGRTTQRVYKLKNGEQLTEVVTYSQSGQVVSTIEQGTQKSYAYDKAGRLVTAKIGDTTLSYSFTQPTSCSALPSANALAYRNANRTSSTKQVGSNAPETTTSCYDSADRLISSSDPQIDKPTYDSHGNTKTLGNSSHRTTFYYDSSDRLMRMVQAGTPAVDVRFQRDVQGRLKQRQEFYDGSILNNARFGYTGAGDSPDFLANPDTSVITERYLSLPGGVMITIVPVSSPVRGNVSTYSLPNLHGDICATVDGTGAKTAVFTYDPFGTPLTKSHAQNVDGGADWGWLGQHQKLSEFDLALKPIQMGQRTYVPSLGRFLSVDPVEGGVENAYVYPPDPINDFDLDGTWSFSLKSAIQAVTVVATVASFIPGPIGMVATVATIGISLAQGDIKGAAFASFGLIGGPAVGKLLEKAAPKVLGKLMTAQAKMPIIGARKGIFAYGAHGSANTGGWMNKGLGKIIKGARIGWAQGEKSGDLVFRMAYRNSKLVLPTYKKIKYFGIR